MRIVLCLIVLLSFKAFSQVDTASRIVKVQSIDAVRVSIPMLRIRVELPEEAVLDRGQIQLLEPTDVGDLVQKVSGSNLKSYGGLGGLKTVSMRGLGSQHTAVSVDGFTQQSYQTGQVNLGQIQTDNIEGIGVVSFRAPTKRGFLPVSALIKGSALSISTFENSFSEDSLSIRAKLGYGSFNQMDSYGAIKLGREKFFVSAFGKYRQMDGDYDYKFLNGNQLENGVRSNNNYQDYYWGASGGVKVGPRSEIRVGIKQQNVDQQLPGAVILYNNTADESLTTNDTRIFIDWKSADRLNKFGRRVYGSVNRNKMRYFDPTYFNSDGKIDRSYQNDVANLGISGRFNYWIPANITYGFEQSIARLTTSDSLFGAPTRLHSMGILGVSKRYSRWGEFYVNVSGQYILDQTEDISREFVGVNPMVSYQSREFGKKFFRHTLWYKNSFRMPSFNEMYYNQIGNADLNPERANQFNYQLSFIPSEKKKFITVRMNAYFNRVQDKIVAIPTQNLFVWSIQNVGKVDIYGADANISFYKNWGNKWSILFLTNYTFQHAIDVTDSESITYGDQIAYIPMHSGNFDVNVTYKKSGLKISNFASSKRYALNQNIEMNEVPGFVVSDIAIYHRFGKQDYDWNQRLKVQFTVKNILNSSYAYVRSFVMPGRNYLMTLSYEFK